MITPFQRGNDNANLRIGFAISLWLQLSGELKLLLYMYLVVLQLQLQFIEEIILQIYIAALLVVYLSNPQGAETIITSQFCNHFAGATN